MKRLAFLIVLMVGCGGGPVRPNVLLIVVDTLRADRLSCYGAQGVATPGIDQLAREGTRFSAAFTQAAFTLPSFTSLMTSLYPYEHQVRNNQTNLHDSFTTLAEVFQSAGYRTGAVLGSAVLAADRNLSQGFDYYDDDFPESLTVYSDLLRKNGIALGDRAQRRAVDVTDLSIRWLEENADEPFFLFAHYFDPHAKYDPPPPFQHRYPRRPYDGEVAYTDAQIDRLLAALGKTGRGNETIVVLAADHGESMGEHLEAEHGFFVYESTIHVPLLIRYPGHVPEGRVENRLVNLIDLMPTICDLTGLVPPEEIRGRSLLPLLQGGEWEPQPAYSEAFLGYFGYGWSPARSIRTDRWKYVEVPDRELYDVQADPGELRNLYDIETDTAERLVAEMTRHLRAEKSVKQVEPETADIGDAQRERLEALGYITTGKRSIRESFSNLPDPKVGVLQFRNNQMAKRLASTSRPLLAAKRYDEGLVLLDQALELNPALPPALIYYGATMMLTGRYAEAEKYYHRLVATDTTNTAYQGNLAIAVTNLGRSDEAIEILERCVVDAPGDMRFQRSLDILIDARDAGDTVQFHFQFNFDPASTQAQ